MDSAANHTFQIFTNVSGLDGRDVEIGFIFRPVFSEFFFELPLQASSGGDGSLLRVIHGGCREGKLGEAEGGGSLGNRMWFSEFISAKRVKCAVKCGCDDTYI